MAGEQEHISAALPQLKLTLIVTLSSKPKNSWRCVKLPVTATIFEKSKVYFYNDPPNFKWSPGEHTEQWNDFKKSFWKKPLSCSFNHFKGSVLLGIKIDLLYISVSNLTWK